MKPNAYRQFAWGLGGLYLTLVVSGAWSPLSNFLPEPWKDMVRAVMDITGTGTDFSFFAPAVSSQVRADILLRDAQGRTERYNFWSADQEIGFRLNSIIGTSMDQPLLRDICARSWAASLLGSRPAAQRVTITAYIHNLPTMTQFSNGTLATWQPFYEGTFARVEPTLSDLP